MRTIKISLAIMAVAAVSGCATTGDGASWKCSAQGLANSHYTGSDIAMIHLQGFSTGGSYKPESVFAQSGIQPKALM